MLPPRICQPYGASEQFAEGTIAAPPQKCYSVSTGAILQNITNIWNQRIVHSVVPSRMHRSRRKGVKAGVMHLYPPKDRRGEFVFTVPTG